jgi:type IV pilus assembly protein PilE
LREFTGRILLPAMACRAHRRRAQGVTLTEILVGLAVLGMLGVILVPTYHAYVIGVNRSDARRDLRALAVQLHRCFERTGDYRVDATGSSNPCVKLPVINAEGTYGVAFAPGEPSPGSFRLLATPRGEQAADSRCGTLSLDDRGNRGIKGTGEAGHCWQGPDD